MEEVIVLAVVVVAAAVVVAASVTVGASSPARSAPEAEDDSIGDSDGDGEGEGEGEGEGDAIMGAISIEGLRWKSPDRGGRSLKPYTLHQRSKNSREASLTWAEAACTTRPMLCRRRK